MPVMAVNNQNQHEQTGDYRSRPRWSAGKKMEAVLRLLRGEPLEVLSRELGVEAHRLAAWRDDFLEGGTAGLAGRAARRPGRVRGGGVDRLAVRGRGAAGGRVPRAPGRSGATRSDRPVPRLSNRIRRENDASRVRNRFSSGSSQ
jgi:transposase-like protein